MFNLDGSVSKAFGPLNVLRGGSSSSHNEVNSLEVRLEGGLRSSNYSYRPLPTLTRLSDEEEKRLEAFETDSTGSQDSHFTPWNMSSSRWNQISRYFPKYTPWLILIVAWPAFCHFIFKNFIFPDWHDQLVKNLSPDDVLFYDQSGIWRESEACDTSYRFTTNKSEADVVVWQNPRVDLDDFKGTGARRDPPWQLNAFWSLENAEYYPQLKKAREGLKNQDRDAFDLEMTYRTSSDVPLSYAYSFMNLQKAPLPFKDRRQDKIAAAFISNCHPKNSRTDVFEKLMKLLPGKIDSFGDCLPNSNLTQTLRELKAARENEKLNKWNEKMRIIERYKFTIAFENADEEDYITEKYYQALEAGSPPIHLGQTPSQFEKFKPSPNAAINVADFPNVEALAKRIEELSEDEERFERMLDWKKKPLRGDFKMIVDWGKENEWCRLSKFLKGRWKNLKASNQSNLRYNKIFSLIESKIKLKKTLKKNKNK